MKDFSYKSMTAEPKLDFEGKFVYVIPVSRQTINKIQLSSPKTHWPFITSLTVRKWQKKFSLKMNAIFRDVTLRGLEGDQKY
jgi:hypothetical protein